MKRERFYVREHTGYSIALPLCQTAGNAQPQTEYMVIDRDYCHRVVRSWKPREGNRGVGLHAASRARHAAELAERLNREHAE